jgi:hypothetical protein
LISFGLISSPLVLLMNLFDLRKSAYSLSPAPFEAREKEGMV